MDSLPSQYTFCNHHPLTPVSLTIPYGNLDSDVCREKLLAQNKLPQVTSLQHLIERLHEVFAGDRVNIEEVHDLLTAYKSNPAEWKKFAKFDRFRYTRNLVDGGNGKFNLMVLCWGEGHGSAIHDHADAHCFMKMLQGELTETRFAWPDDDGENCCYNHADISKETGLKEMSCSTLSTNSVCYINDSLGLHRVENPNYSEAAVSLHLYCPPFDSCSVFNQQTGQRSRSKVTFWSKFGEKKDKSVQDNREPEDN